jgi:hypothetical protein
MNAGVVYRARLTYEWNERQCTKNRLVPSGMLLSKNQFFFGLLFLVLAPFIVVNGVWLLRSQKTIGKVQGIGEHLGMNLGPSTYALVSFPVANDTVWFRGVDQNYKYGDQVPVRYLPSHPSDAKIATVLSIWGDTFAYGGVAFIFWIVCFLSKDLVPATARVRIGKKPFLQIIPAPGRPRR